MALTGARENVVPMGLADEIAYRLRVAILNGEFPPGTHLQQDELCTRFGVSRTPVREALRKLQAQNLVHLVPNKGATVRTLTRDELIEVYALRAELEGFATQLAAGQIASSDIENLDDMIGDASAAMDALGSGPVSARSEATLDARIRAANEEFHSAIHALSGNQRLRKYVLELQEAFPKDYVWRAVGSTEQLRKLNLDEHAAIRDALANRDGPTARKLMEAHIRNAGKLLLAHLDEHQIWGG